MKTQTTQKKSESRNHADSVGRAPQDGELQSSINSSPLMAAQRMQKESLQMAEDKKKKPAQKAEDKKKKPGQKKSDKEL